MARPDVRPTADDDPSARLWDVVVVGAGPAGSSAAFAARAAGAEVLVVERAELPRDKLCGGGLLQTSLDHLPPGTVVPWRADVRRVSFSYRGRLTRTRRSTSSVLGMVYRREFDQRLVDVARSTGVKVLDRCTVRELTDDGDVVTLLSSAGPLRARAVVGADGSAGRTSRFVGARFAEVDLGLETEVRLSPAQQRVWRDRAHLDWGRVPGSYGWAFPKGEHLTVGVILDRRRGGQGQAYLTELIDSLGLADAERIDQGGHLTHCRADGSPLARDRVLLAGDAAGLLEPWTREGISFALRSGARAGRAAARMAAGGEPGAVGAEYTAEIETTLGSEIRAGRACLRAYERRPILFHLVLACTPPGWLAFRRLATGRTTFPRLMRHRVVRLALAAARL